MKWFLNFKTRGKLFAGFGLMLVFLATVIVTAYLGITAIQSSQKSLYQKEFSNTLYLLTLRSDENGMRAALLSMMVTTKRSDQDSWHQDIKQASVQNVSGTRQAEVAAQGLHELGQRLKLLAEQYKV